jgi:hypothetical protein
MDRADERHRRRHPPTSASATERSSCAVHLRCACDASLGRYCMRLSEPSRCKHSISVSAPPDCLTSTGLAQARTHGRRCAVRHSRSSRNTVGWPPRGDECQALPLRRAPEEHLWPRGPSPSPTILHTHTPFVNTEYCTLPACQTSSSLARAYHARSPTAHMTHPPNSHRLLTMFPQLRSGGQQHHKRESTHTHNGGVRRACRSKVAVVSSASAVSTFPVQPARMGGS